MIYKTLFTLLLIAVHETWGQYDFMLWDRKYVKCEICKAIIDEIYDKISITPPTKRLEKQGYTLDDKDVKRAPKPAAQLNMSQLFLSEVMDGICEKMNEYVRAEHRETGTVEVMKLINGKMMNPDLKDYNILKDGDLESLPFYCDSVVSEYEEEIVAMFLRGDQVTDVKYSVCLNSEICMSQRGSSVEKEEL